MTGFEHLHPTENPDGTWSLPVSSISVVSNALRLRRFEAQRTIVAA